VSIALGGLFRCGCNYICTRLLLLTSTIGTSLQPITRKGKPRAPKVAKLMEELRPLCPSTLGQLLELFFRGFADPLCLPYLNNDNLTPPCEFSFETGCNDVHSIAIFNAFIHPYILPVEFCGGRQVQSTFEYYQPNMMARQLGCGQVPPRIFLHEFLKPREDIKESMQAKMVFEYKCSATVYAPRPFVPTTVTHPSFIP
jgi:hypothetical protein